MISTNRLLGCLRRQLIHNGRPISFRLAVRVAIEVTVIIVGAPFPPGYKTLQLSVNLVGGFLEAHRDRVAQAAVDQIQVVGTEAHDA